jgi:hypothetical protein
MLNNEVSPDGPSAVVQTFQSEQFGNQSKSFQSGERIDSLPST